MSQKVKIKHVIHKGGEVFVGDDERGVPIYTRDPNRIMDWLCDAWRYRYNNLREQRTVPFPAAKDSDGNVLEWGERPIAAGTVHPKLTAKQMREQHPWTACVPSGILRSPDQLEWKEWEAARKRRATRKAKGQSPGEWPGFKSYKRNGQSFVCWRNESKVGNAIFHKTGRKSGVVFIGGLTHKEYRRAGEQANWKICIHVRVSQEIRDYTSVVVDWSRKTLVFVNEPLPVQRPSYTGRTVGIDRGCVHTVATSQGKFFDMPQPYASEVRRYKELQRSLARKDRVAKDADGKGVSTSKRRRAVLDDMERIRSKVNRRKDDWCHKLTTELVKRNDAVCVEDLNVQGMSNRCKAKPDPDNPGRWLPNGQSSKAQLNRSIMSNRWGVLAFQLEYKCKYAGVAFAKVNPAYTSQRCSACGHVASENRESQAVFRCVACGHEDNADINAAVNVEVDGLAIIAKESLGAGHAPGRGSKCKTGGALMRDASSCVTTAPDRAGDAQL